MTKLIKEKIEELTRLNDLDSIPEAELANFLGAKVADLRKYISSGDYS